jgi:signal transduction histidine kinase
LYLAIAGLITILVGFVCLLSFYLTRQYNQQKKAWSAFCIADMLWGFGLFHAYTATTYSDGLFWLRFLNYAAMGIPLFFVHFSLLISGEHAKRRSELRACYIFIFLLSTSSLLWPELFIPSVRAILHFDYYPVPGPFYHLFTLFFVFAMIRSLFFLYLEYQRTLALRRQQFAYLFLGIVLTFGGGGMTLLPVYGFRIEPYGALLAPFMMALTTLVLLRYDVENIRVFVSRALIVTLVSGIAISLPLVVGFSAGPILQSYLGSRWWAVPVILGVLLTAVAMILFDYWRRLNEKQLEHDSVRYQTMLLRASFGLGRIKEIGKLSRFIVRLLVWSMQLEHAFVYLFEREDNLFYLNAWRRRHGKSDSPRVCLASDSPLLDYLYSHRLPIAVDEVKLRARDDENITLDRVGREMDAFEAAAILPCWIQDRLVGFVVIGPRVNRNPMGREELALFSILGGHLALAFENALSFEDLRRTQEHLVESEKMATIGTLAGGLSHQLNNRFTSLIFFTKNLDGMVSGIRNKTLTSDVADRMQALLRKIEEGISSSKEVMHGILNYSSDRSGVEPFTIRKLIDASIEMAGFKVTLENVKLRIDFPDDLPPIHGNFAQLQEVIFNMIDNAYHSMMEKKALGLDAAYEPLLAFNAKQTGAMLILTVVDNGIGVRPEDMKKLFSPFFSTKSSEKKGYGLGLYVMRQIIEKNHGGRITFRSQYGKGALIEIALPVRSLVGVKA